MKNPIEKVQDRLKRLSDKTYKDVVPYLPGQTYFYVYGFKEVKNSKGQLVTKLYADGPFMYKGETEVRLGELALDYGDIHESKSRDLSRVKKEVAALLAHEEHLPVEVATQRKYKGRPSE